MNAVDLVVVAIVAVTLVVKIGHFAANIIS